MNWRRNVPKVLFGVALSWIVAVGQVQAMNMNTWTYEGTGVDTVSGLEHTVSGFLELDFGPPVGVDTPFNRGNVVNSEFTVAGPSFGGGVPATNTFSFGGSFTFDNDMLSDVMGMVNPPDRLGCIGDITQGCFAAYVGGAVSQFFSLTIFNGDDWQFDAFLLGGAVLAQNDPGGTFVLSGTGQWFPPSPAANPVPEPSTMLLLGSGLVGLVGWQMRKRKG